MKSTNLASRKVSSVFAVSVFLCFCAIASADEPEPVEIGSSCGDPDAIYHLTSDIQKTAWQLNGLYAVPTGTNNPELWEQSSSFNAQFIATLQEQEGAAAYAEACGTIWQNFFSEQADVIVTLKRTITSTVQILQCVSGTWVYSSTQYLEFEDVSDWLTLSGSPFDVTSESSVLQLQTSLQNLIDDLNSQPGSESEP